MGDHPSTLLRAGKDRPYDNIKTMKRDIHHRRSIRLRGYDYSQAGAYFVTVCVQGRHCLFGGVVNGEMRLNDAGRMAQTVWEGLPDRFPSIELDAFVVMPNHVHGIIVLLADASRGRGESCIRPGVNDENANDHKGDHKDRPYGTLAGTIGRVIQAFKSIVTHEYVMGVRQHVWPPFVGRLWQRNYYEHIIRDAESLNRIREYILTNPLRWALDRENPRRTGEDEFNLYEMS